MTIEVKGSGITQLLEGSAGATAATYFLEAVIKGVREKIIKEEIEPMEAILRMDHVSSAIIGRKLYPGMITTEVNPRRIATADRIAAIAEIANEQRLSGMHFVSLFDF